MENSSQSSITREVQSSFNSPHKTLDINRKLNQNDETTSISTLPSSKDWLPCNACILWSPKISLDLQLHENMNYELFTTLSIGKLLSEAVIVDNPAMDWKQPFILVDVLNDGYTVIGKWEDNISIPVVEKSAFLINPDQDPTGNKKWYLNLSYSLIKLGLEMLRKLPTTVMIWGGRMCPFQNGDERVDFNGHIHVDTSDQVNTIIFHQELITEEKVEYIQDNFELSELRLFQDDRSHRIVCNEVDEVFAVHFSKNSAGIMKRETIREVRSRFVELLGVEDSEDELNKS